MTQVSIKNMKAPRSTKVRGFQKGINMNYTQNNAQVPYSKVKNNTHNYLKSKKASSRSRLVYLVLGSYLDYDSSNARATYDQICHASGIGSYQTVSRCLSELIDKGLIVRIGRSRYKLTYGIYMGITENENKTEKTIPASPSQKQANTTPSVVKKNPPIYSNIILINNKLRKSRHENSEVVDRFPDVGKTIKADDISNLKFKKDSAFKGIPKSTLYKLVRRYGFHLLQDRITKLDGCYDIEKIRKSPESLLYAALRDNGEWKYKTKTGEVIKLREPSHEQTQIEIQKDRETKKAGEGYRLKMEVFKERNPVVIERFKREIKEETPRAMNIGFMFEIAMNAKISEYIGGITTLTKNNRY